MAMLAAYARQLAAWALASAVVFAVVASKPWWPKKIDRLDPAAPVRRVCGPPEGVVGEVGLIAVGMETVRHLEVTPDGRWALAAAANAGPAFLVDLTGRLPPRELPTAGEQVAAMAVSPDGRRAAIASAAPGRGVQQPVLELWDLSSGARPMVLAGSAGPIRQVAFSADGKELHAAAQDGILRTWSADDGRLVRSLEKLKGSAWAVSGNRFVSLAAQTAGTEAVLRDLLTGQALATVSLFGREGGGRVIGFSDDLSRAFVSFPRARTAQPRLEVHHLTGQGKPLTLRGGTTSIDCARLTPDGRRIVTIDGAGSLTIWDAGYGRPLLCLRRTQRGQPWAGPITVLPNGRIVCPGGRGILAVLRVPLAAGEGPAATQPGANLALSVSSDGQRILAVNADPPQARLLDARTGRQIAAADLPLPPNRSSANGKAAAAADAGMAVFAGEIQPNVYRKALGRFGVFLVRLPGGAEPMTPAGNLPDQPNAVAISPDGRLSFVSTPNGSSFYESGHSVSVGGSMSGVSAAALSPDGTRLACFRFGELLLAHCPSGKEVARLPVPAETRALAFSPDGGRLAFGTHTGLIGLIDLSTRREIARLDGHQGEISALAFSRGGGRLASAGRDGTVRLWDLAAWRLLGRWDAASTADTLAFTPDGRLLAGGADRVQYLPVPAERRP